jgi:Flp pilus assembly pilin Flp
VLQAFHRDEDGATAIEYGLIVAMIAVFLLSIAATGGAVEELYNVVLRIAEAISG